MLLSSCIEKIDAAYAHQGELSFTVHHIPSVGYYIQVWRADGKEPEHIAFFAEDDFLDLEDTIYKWYPDMLGLDWLAMK